MAEDDNPTADVPSTHDDEDRSEGNQPELVFKDSQGSGRNGTVSPHPAEDDAEQPELAEVRIESAEQVVQIVQAVLETRQESYAGLLPHPEHWDKFEPDTQERILRMSEAFTTDESVRRDLLVKGNISESKNARRNAFVLMLLSFAGLIVCQSLFGNPWLSSLFLGYPTFQAISTFIPDRSTPRKPAKSEERPEE